MKKSIMNPELAQEDGKNYENRIPMRLWAEDDLPSQKLLLKGNGSLSDAELLSIIIGSGVSGENSLDIAKKMLSTCGNSLCEFWKFGVSDLQKIKGIVDMPTKLTTPCRSKLTTLCRYCLTTPLLLS